MGVLIKWCDLPIKTKKVFMWYASNTKKLRLLFLIVFVKLCEYRDDFKFFLSEILFYNQDYHDGDFFWMISKPTYFMHVLGSTIFVKFFVLP